VNVNFIFMYGGVWPSIRFGAAESARHTALQFCGLYKLRTLDLEAR